MMLFVSTSLSVWATDEPERFARDLQINDTMYRRLDPEYYAWLRSRMALAKQAATAGRLDAAAFEDLRVRFNAVHVWAVEHFGESQLLDAINSPDVRDYKPPVTDTQAASRHATSTAGATEPAPTALVDAIRDPALALGWTLEALYCRPDGRRTSIGSGLVWFLRPDWRIGKVTRQWIELLGPEPLAVRQRFYNPDVDQPWLKKKNYTV